MLFQNLYSSFSEKMRVLNVSVSQYNPQKRIGDDRIEVGRMWYSFTRTKPELLLISNPLPLRSIHLYVYRFIYPRYIYKINEKVHNCSRLAVIIDTPYLLSYGHPNQKPPLSKQPNLLPSHDPIKLASGALKRLINWTSDRFYANRNLSRPIIVLN